MPVEVYTESTCDRCGATDRLVGAHQYRSPPSWFTAEIMEHSASTAEYSEGQTLDFMPRAFILCPTCGAAARQAMAPLARTRQ